MNTFKFIISTPEGKAFEDKISEVSLRGKEGNLSILAGHIPVVTLVVPCVCVLTLKDGSQKEGKIKSGILSVGIEETVLATSNFELK